MTTKRKKSNPQAKVLEETGQSLLIKKWLTGDEICHILGISKRTLQSYRTQRRIPYYQIGRKIYYKTTDVDDLLERHHIKSNYQKGGAA